MKKYFKYLFVVTIILLASLYLYLINNIYTQTLEDAKLNHQKQQMEMARVVAQGVGYFLEHLVKDVKIISESPALKTGSKGSTEEIIDHFRTNYDKAFISSLIIYNDDLSISYVSGKDPPLWVYGALPSLSESVRVNQEFVVSEVYPDIADGVSNGNSFLIMLPLKHSSSDRLIVCIVNFDYLIKYFILPLKLNSNDFVWILDGSGRLIFHPRHEEMLFNSIYTTDEECLSCHITFDNQKKMIASVDPDFGEYSVVGDEPAKVFAFVPLSFQNQKWFISVSTFLPDVIAGLKGRFTLFFLLGVVILVSLLFFLFVVYYLNLKRVRAEEIGKNLEKIQNYQEQLNHTSRLASIGELVDSVAHEINTPVGIISAHADSIILNNPEAESFSDELKIIKKQTRRIGDYTRTLLNFSRRIPFNPENINLWEVIDESLFLLNHRIRRKRIHITKDGILVPHFARVDRRQMEQVVINIINNAIDAVHHGGWINIMISDLKTDPTMKKQESSDDNVEIRISDNGSGIASEDIDKIFDAFYSTKSHNGTGLGLSISKRIMQRHKGDILVESKTGEGTTFIITLPRNSRNRNEQEK